jgi:hypothetical protein
MIHALDHLSLAVPAARLTEAARDYEILLGRRAQHRPGCCSFQLANVRLELVAADTEAPGLVALAFAVEDLEGWARLLGRRRLPIVPAGPGEVGAPLALSADRQATYGVAMRFCRRGRGDARPIAEVLRSAEETAVRALDHLVIRTPNPERAIDAGRLGLSFAP